MRHGIALALACFAVLPAAGQGQTPAQGADAAVAVGSLFDQIMADQQRRKGTPMVHRKSGLRPSPGSEVTARQGEAIVARVEFETSYLARPRANFVNSVGVPVKADDIRALLMLNNKFCVVGGEHCFDDKDRDGDWDGAAQARGRWADVPYEVFELRKEIEGGSRRELFLASANGPVVRYREFFAGTIVMDEACAVSPGGSFRCHNLAVQALSQEGGTARFLVDLNE